MKRLYIYMGIFVVIAISYTTGWFFVAHRIEKEVHNYLDNLKAENKIKKYSAAISVSGFPFSFNVKFAKPSVGFNLPEDHTNINASFEGDVNVSAGLFSKFLTLTTAGNANFQGNIGDYKFDMISEGDRVSSYQIKLKNMPISPFFILDASSISKSLNPNYTELVEGVAVDIKVFTLHDKISNKDVVTSTRISLNLSGSIAEGNINVSGVENIEKLKFFNQATVIWQQMQKIPAVRDLVHSMSNDVKHYLSVFSLPELGLINYQVDFNYVGDGAVHKINFAKLNLRDDLYVIEAKGGVNVSAKGAGVDLKSSLICSDHWYILMKEYLDKFESHEKVKLFNFNDQSILGLIFSPINSFFSQLLESSGQGKYVPQLNLVGPIKTEAKLLYKAQANNMFDLKIKDFHLNTRSYFIDIEGNFQHQQDKDIYDIRASIGNYTNVVDQIVEYVNRVTAASTVQFKILGNSKAISSSVTDRIKRFIRNISDNPSSQSKDIKLTLVNKGNSIYPAAGRYNSEEFKQAWQMFVASIIIDKAAAKVEKLLKKGVGDSLKDVMQGNVLGGVKDVAEGVLGLLN